MGILFRSTPRVAVDGMKRYYGHPLGASGAIEAAIAAALSNAFGCGGATASLPLAAE